MAQAPSTPARPRPPADAAPREEGQPPGPEVRYVCPGGTDFSAAFSKDGDLATLMVAGPARDRVAAPALRARASPIGDSYYELRGRGREATLTAAGRSMRCHAAGRPGDPPRTFAGAGLTVTLFPDGTFRLRERRDGTGEPSLDLGQWTQEVDGGVRLVLRGSLVARRAFRQADGDRLIADERHRTGADAPPPTRSTGGSGSTASIATPRTAGCSPSASPAAPSRWRPGGAEPDLERAWIEAAPSRDAQLFFQILGRFTDDGEIEVERVLNLQANATCPPPAPRSAALRDTEWRAVEIDGERLAFGDGRATADADARRRRQIHGLDRLQQHWRRLRARSQRPALRRRPDDPGRLPAAVRCRRAALHRRPGRGQERPDRRDTLDLKDASGKLRLRLEARGR